ncbi:MAG: hypothetical protein R3C68_10970 [Myxococcota bacterium]
MCEDQGFLNCLLQVDLGQNPGTRCSGGQCTYTDAAGNDTLCFEQPDAGTLFGGLNNTELAAGNDYNQPYQILQKVADIMELQERFQIGDLRVHSGLVLDPFADPAVIEVFGDPAQAIPLMEQVADIGEGRFLQFNGGDSIDFVSINFDSIKQQRVVRSFYADNQGARLETNGLLSDTDFDGLSDQTEFAIGTDSRLADTDGDGYSDYLEWKLRGFAFDANDPCLPALVDDPNSGASPGNCNPAAPVNCMRGFPGPYLDTDSDGLNDCEERQLGTNTRNADTDQGWFARPFGFYLGLDPLRWDADGDNDQDALTNAREIEWHLNPVIEQSQVAAREHYRYNRPKTGTSIDGRTCFDFGINNIDLTASGEPEVITQFFAQTPGQRVGYNQIRLYIAENMSDDLSGLPLYRTACVMARYVPPVLKVPQKGKIRLLESDFKYVLGSDPIFNDPQVLSNLFNPTLSGAGSCLWTCDHDNPCPAGLTCDAGPLSLADKLAPAAANAVEPTFLCR